MALKIKLDKTEDHLYRAYARERAESSQSSRIYARHPWPFLRDCVYTLDQATRKVRKFPSTEDGPNPKCTCGGCISYQHHVVNVWDQKRILVVPKSRRMMLTWTMVAAHYWLARFHPGTSIAFVSRKQGINDSEGSAELVKRAKFIHDHLPPKLQTVKVSYSWCRLLIHTDPQSEIIGVGQGADQLRQLTLTAIMADEMAFWEEAQPTYVASLPTIEGGGRFTGISSPNPGFFKLLVHDMVDAA